MHEPGTEYDESDDEESVQDEGELEARAKEYALFSYCPPDMEEASEKIMEESYKEELHDDLVRADYSWAEESFQEHLLPKEASLRGGSVMSMCIDGIEASYGRWMDRTTSLLFIVTLPKDKETSDFKVNGIRESNRQQHDRRGL